MAPSRRPLGPSILKSAQTKMSLRNQKQRPGMSILKCNLSKTSKVAVATPKVKKKSLEELTPAVTSSRKRRSRRPFPSSERSDEEPLMKQIKLGIEKDCLLKCCFCQKELKGIDSFVSHFNNSHKQKICDLWLQCHVCQTYLPTERMLKAHCSDLHHVKARDHTPPQSQLYCCELCGKEFIHAIIFNQHARTKHKDILEFTWIPCKMCGVSFKWQDWFDEHLVKSHRQLRVDVVRLTWPAILPKHNPIVCSLCPCTFFDPSMYINHANVYHRGDIQLNWIDCPKCGLIIPSRDALQFHLILNHDEDVASKTEAKKINPIKCFSCVKTFFDPFALVRHANETHLRSVEGKWLNCQACDQYFPSADVLQLHSILAHEDINAAGPNRIKCNLCTEVFNDPFMYYDHANSGHKLGNIWKACQKCDLHFPDIYTLQYHTVISHNNMTKKKEYTVTWMGALKNNKYLLQCVECEFTFIDPFKYHAHANKEHFEELKSFWIECELCQMIFPSDDTLLYHNLYFHGRRRLLRQEWEKNLARYETVPVTQFPECHLCGLKLGNYKLLEKHIMKHSAKIKAKKESTKCQFCNANFPSKSLYFKHANASHKSHAEIFWTQCTLCNMYLPTKSDFPVHFYDAHLPAHEKKSSQISCEFCILQFFNKRDLIKHANKCHQKLLVGKWVECEFCQMFVMNKRQLFYHMKQAHTEKMPPGKTWRCKLCKKLFLSERSYKNHKACNQSSESEVEDDSEDDLRPNSKLYTSTNNGKGPEDPEMSDDDFEDSKFNLDVVFNSNEEEDFRISNDNAGHEETVLELMGRGKVSPVFCQFCLVVLDSMNLYLHHATNTHQNQIEKLWTQCLDCSFYFPDEEILARHKYKYHEHPSDQEESEEGEADEPKEKLQLADSQPVKAKENSGPIKITMNVGRRRLEMQIKTQEIIGDAQAGGRRFDPLGMGKQNEERSPRRKSDGSKTGKEIKKTVNVEAKDPQKVYKCVPCNKVFSKRVNLRKHERKFHKVEKICEKCGKKFLILRDFEKHAAQEPCNEPKKIVYACSVCDKKFRLKYRLVAHMNRVHTQHPAHYKCRICSKTFALAIYLKTHCLRVHKINEDDPESLLETAEKDPSDDESKPIERADGEFECKNCGKRFGNRKNARRHYKVMHTELEMTKCEICSKSFPTGSSFNKHVKIVHMRKNEVNCGICSRTFSGRSSLKVHLKAVHRSSVQNIDKQTDLVDDGPILSCETCNLTFTNTSSMRKHFELVHANQYIVKCQHCDQVYDDLDALEVHVNTCHQSLRSYKCSRCEMVFGERSVCEEHILAVHMQEERFVCQQCDQIFESESLLDGHLATHQATITHVEEPLKEGEVVINMQPSIVVEIIPYGVPLNIAASEDGFYDTVH